MQQQESENIPITDVCPQCGAVIDVTGLGLFSEITCPSCQQQVTVRTRLDNYRLLQRIGKGGMGEVFRAFDENLQREIALKVLHKQFTGSEEGRSRLAEEARRTASVNHPHVVKVFNYGSSGGQFYLAMELVPHGTLDDLMELQGRISEVQVLTVAIQVAGGLQAALECGLIHRDIKPGNILFSDASTAKLVDFGLALVMDEVAAAKGEIWGTPYYIAPEKLDGGDEDFRSDIYSLGGTLFHALAGRPPYEAETASMVALKQLKSQPVSLQTYAPDISEETTYIVNRMMAKDQADRYQSYTELIQHLEYSRNKLLQRLQSGAGTLRRPEVVQVESSSQRKSIGIAMLALLVGFFVLALIGFFNRERVLNALGISTQPSAAQVAAKSMEAARETLLRGDVTAAIPMFETLAKDQTIGQPMQNWAALQLGIAQLLEGRGGAAARTFAALQRGGLYSEAPGEIQLAGFFVELAGLLSAPRVSAFPQFSQENYEAIGTFAAGLHNWTNGNPVLAAQLLRQFAEAPAPKAPYTWIADFKPLAAKLVADAEAFAPLQFQANSARTPEEKAAALQAIQNAPTFQADSILKTQLRTLSERLEGQLNRQ